MRDDRIFSSHFFYYNISFLIRAFSEFLLFKLFFHHTINIRNGISELKISGKIKVNT